MTYNRNGGFSFRGKIINLPVRVPAACQPRGRTRVVKIRQLHRGCLYTSVFIVYCRIESRFSTFSDSRYIISTATVSIKSRGGK